MTVQLLIDIFNILLIIIIVWGICKDVKDS